MKKIIIFLLFLSVNFFVFSQSADDSEIKTIRFQEDENGYIQFYTNDPAYSASLVTDSSPEENTNSNGFEMEIKTISGSENVGGGMVFGAEDDYNWYAVFISPNGYFEIVRCKDLRIGTLKGGNTRQIIRGLGKTNSIKVIQKKGEYKIYLNNKIFPLYTIKDIDIEGNKIGHCVNLGGSFRLFPEGYVDIRYRKKEA
jgi:hypothetical protein